MARVSLYTLLLLLLLAIVSKGITATEETSQEKRDIHQWLLNRDRQEEQRNEEENKQEYKENEQRLKELLNCTRHSTGIDLYRCARISPAERSHDDAQFRIIALRLQQDAFENHWKPLESTLHLSEFCCNCYGGCPSPTNHGDTVFASAWCGLTGNTGITAPGPWPPPRSDYVYWDQRDQRELRDTRNGWHSKLKCITTQCPLSTSLLDNNASDPYVQAIWQAQSVLACVATRPAEEVYLCAVPDAKTLEEQILHAQEAYAKPHYEQLWYTLTDYLRLQEQYFRCYGWSLPGEQGEYYALDLIKDVIPCITEALYGPSAIQSS